LNILFFETSAKTSYNVHEMFTYLARVILNSSKKITENDIYDLKRDQDKRMEDNDIKCYK